MIAWRSLILSQLCASKIFSFDYSDRLLGVCPSHPSLRGEGAAGRCEAAGSKKPEAYSLKYVEDFFGPGTTQMAADHLPQKNGMTRTNS